MEEVLAKNTATNEHKVLKIKELQSSTNEDPVDLENTQHDDVSQIPEHHIEKAKKRYAIIEPLLKTRTTKQVESRAKECKVSPASIHSWVKTYSNNPKLSSLVFEGTILPQENQTINSIF